MEGIAECNQGAETFGPRRYLWQKSSDVSNPCVNLITAFDIFDSRFSTLTTRALSCSCESSCKRCSPVYEAWQVLKEYTNVPRMTHSRVSLITPGAMPYTASWANIPLIIPTFLSFFNAKPISSAIGNHQSPIFASCKHSEKTRRIVTRPQSQHAGR